MAPGRKLGDSCWTCRLRRKRCDAVRPVCRSCQDLDITCYTGNVRPSWMDGSARQKHMSETIKRTIKENALLRKERQQLILPLSRQENQPADTTTVTTLSTTSETLSSSNEREYESHAQPHPFTTTDPLPFSGDYTPPTDASPPRPSSTAWSVGLGIAVQAPIQVQLASIMVYLDYVFPFLFPFYRPSILETGRQWLLGSLCQNEVSFHTAASLSAYFTSLVPRGDGQEIRDECRAMVRDRLLSQMDLALKTIQMNISTMNRSPQAGSSLTDKARTMEEITQLLIVEVTVRRDADWATHLTPALALFDELFRNHGTDHSGQEPRLAVLLSALPHWSFPGPTPHDKPLPNTSDQSALVFFVTLLLFVDIVASTSLGRAPILQSYHESLLSPQDQENCPVRLESVVGCQNWPLVAIGRIASLCAWKHEAKQSGRFSVVELVSLAAPISHVLDEGLGRLDSLPPRAELSSIAGSVSLRLEGYYRRHDQSSGDESVTTVTRIWAHAAKLYLSVALSGWQPKSAEVQHSVDRVVSLLQTVDSPAQIRSLSWPICVAGCLATRAQEGQFRRLVGVVGELSEFGMIGTVLRIIEAAWGLRDTVDGSAWDITSFLCALGTPALLI